MKKGAFFMALLPNNNPNDRSNNLLQKEKIHRRFSWLR